MENVMDFAHKLVKMKRILSPAYLKMGSIKMEIEFLFLNYIWMAINVFKK